MSKNLSLFNLNISVKDVKGKPSESEKASKEKASKPSEKASVKASDWEQIFQVVKKYIYNKCWDTRLDKDDIVQECMLYIFQNLQNSQKEKITPFYVTCFVKNFVNRVLLKNKNKNGNGKTGDKQGNLFFAVDFEDSEQDLYYRCAKSVFHLENFVPFESLRKI